MSGAGRRRGQVWRATAERARGRRAFTLLEMVLAVMVGSMVVVLSIALLTGIERGNTMLSARTEQTAEMQTTRLVMNRAFSSILAAQPPQNQGRGPAVATAEGAEPAAPTRMQAPRVMLDVAGDVGGVMERREPDGTVVQQTPQRLEIVLLDSPVASASNLDPFALARVAKREAARKQARERGATGGGSGDLLSTLDSIAAEESGGSQRGEEASDATRAGEEALLEGGEGDGSEEGGAGTEGASGRGEEADAGDLGVRAIRGVFELRAQQMTVAQREQLPERMRGKPVYELWWRPVASPESVEQWLTMSRGERLVEAARVGRATKLASNLTFARWRMFDDREKRTRYEATVYNQLPAYAEFEVETTAGLRHQWLFEIGWAIGPETSAEREAQRASGPRNTIGSGGETPAAGGSGRVEPGNGTGAGGAGGGGEGRSGAGKTGGGA